MVLLTVTAVLDETDLAKGELSHPRMVIVLFVTRPADVPPQNAVLETPVNSDLEYPNITPEVVLDRAWLLGSQPSCKVSRQAILQVHKLRPTVVRCFVYGCPACTWLN